MKGKSTKPRKPASLFTCRKYRGDDYYSWAVFRRNSFAPIYNGMSRYEARAMADRLDREARSKQS